VFEDQQSLIQQVDTLHDVDLIADEFLIYLKHTVGWTNELDSITESLTPDQLRKLIELSAPFWKTKGTESGLRDALRLLTGRDVVLRNWFHYRWVVGIARLWRLGDERDPFVVGDTAGARDQFLSFVFVSIDSGVDRQLVRDLVNLHRPLQEVYNVVYVEVVDDFALDRSKWVTSTGAEPTLDEVRKLLSVPVGTTVRVNVEAVETWDEASWRHTMTFTGASGGAFRVLFRRQTTAPNDRYRVTFGQDGTAVLEQVVGGVPTVLDSGSVPHVIPQDQQTMFGIDVLKDCAGRLLIEIRIYDVLVASATIDEPDIVPPGRWFIANVGGDVAELDNVIGYALPVHVDTVSGPDTVSPIPDPNEPAPCVVVQVDSFAAWTLTSQWHDSTFRYVTPGVALYYGTGESGYHTWGTAGAMGPGIVTGTATSPSIDLSDYPDGEYEVFLEFDMYSDVRASASDDVVTGEVLVSGSPVFTFTATPAQKSSAVWFHVRTPDLSASVAGEADVRIRFTVDTVTVPSGSLEGVFVDRVRVLVREE